MADAPLLGSANDTNRLTGSQLRNARDLHTYRGIFHSILKIFRSGLIAPSDTTYGSIMILLNCEDAAKQDELTKQWRDHKLSELSFIGVVSPLTAVCLVSTFSWPSDMSRPSSEKWFVRALWFSGIIFALFSVLTAAQQTLRLHRLSAHRDGLHYIRLCLVRDLKLLDSEGGETKLVPRSLQVWSWQSAMTFLFMAVMCLIAGMLTLVWSAVAKDSGGFSWDGNAKLAVTYTVVLFASIAYFLATQISLMIGVAME